MPIHSQSASKSSDAQPACTHSSKALNPHRQTSRIPPLSSIDASDQEVSCLISVTAVGQVRRRDVQRAHTHQVSRSAEDLCLLGWEVRLGSPKSAHHECLTTPVATSIINKKQTYNLSTILQVLRIPKRHRPINPPHDIRRQVFHSTMNQRCSLRVPTDHDGRVRAIGGSLGDEIRHGADATAISATGDEIGRQCGGVVDALDGDVVAAKLGLEVARERGADYGALRTGCC